MVEDQLRARGIRNEAVLSAMARVPRELFVPAQLRHAAYSDEALPIGGDQTISQPYMVGRMTELLEPAPGKRILEIGTGSGYQAAVLAYMGCRVISIERKAELVDAAAQRIADLGLGDYVTIEIGDGSVGRPEYAPFDGIIVTAAAPAIPPSLPDQLAIGGRLLVPVGRRDHQELVMLIRDPEGFARFDCGPCIFVPLVGQGGFEAEKEGPSRWFGRWI
jgi:protein-L-isoaspartate(D-aspartate) O-methyltransferase